MRAPQVPAPTPSAASRRNTLHHALKLFGRSVLRVGRAEELQHLGVLCRLDTNGFQHLVNGHLLGLVVREGGEHLPKLLVAQEAHVISNHGAQVADRRRLHHGLGECARVRGLFRLHFGRLVVADVGVAQQHALPHLLLGGPALLFKDVIELFLRRREPQQPELLLVDELVRLQQPQQLGLDALLVHSPDVLKSPSVRRDEA